MVRLKLKKLRLSLILPATYLLTVILFGVGYLADMGHGSNAFDFLFRIVFSACHLMDLLPDLLTVRSMPMRFLMCVIEGIILYGALGLILDLVWDQLRKRSIGSNA